MRELRSETTSCAAELKTSPDDRKCLSDIKNAVKAGGDKKRRKKINKQTNIK